MSQVNQRHSQQVPGKLTSILSVQDINHHQRERLQRVQAWEKLAPCWDQCLALRP